MSAKKVTLPDIREAKKTGRKLVMVTAYGYPFGLMADEAGVDIVLVGEDVVDWRHLSESIAGRIPKSSLVIGLSDNPQATGVDVLLSPEMNAYTLKAILQQHFSS